MTSDFNSVQSGQRVHIGFFGCTNSGKSSLINAIAGQDVSIVSDVKGTTTDPVKKAMELLPIGAVMLYDTAGLDDETELGAQRTAKTFEVLRHTDIAVIVIDSRCETESTHEKLIKAVIEKGIPYVLVYSKCDLHKPEQKFSEKSICVSSVTGGNVQELKELIARVYLESRSAKKRHPLIEDLVTKESLVLLVTPIDGSAPKGRLILPQVQTIRAALDSHAVCVAVQPEELGFMLSQLKKEPQLVITDSQAFGRIKDIVPENVPLTSFSILMARYKGVLHKALDGIEKLKELKDGDTVLISEGCTHHRQCGDIGREKIPAALRKISGRELIFEFSSGNSFPDDISRYAAVVHCGGCMLNAVEVGYRQLSAEKQNVPFINYGMVLAEASGILERSVSVFER